MVISCTRLLESGEGACGLVVMRFFQCKFNLRSPEKCTVRMVAAPCRRDTSMLLAGVQPQSRCVQPGQHIDRQGTSTRTKPDGVSIPVITCSQHELPQPKAGRQLVEDAGTRHFGAAPGRCRLGGDQEPDGAVGQSAAAPGRPVVRNRLDREPAGAKE